MNEFFNSGVSFLSGKFHGEFPSSTTVVMKKIKYSRKQIRKNSIEKIYG